MVSLGLCDGSGLRGEEDHKNPAASRRIMNIHKPAAVHCQQTAAHTQEAARPSTQLRV